MASGFSTATAGAELTREQVVATLLQPLLAASVVLRSGVRVFDSEGGTPIRVPKLTGFPLGTGTGSAATYWIAENELIPETDPTFGEVTLLPSTLPSVKVLHRFSNELARHSVIDIATTLASAIVRRVALALDAAFISGDGDGVTGVRGILNTPGIQGRTYDTALDLDDVLDAVGALLGVNANPSVWWLHSADFIALAKLKDTTGRPLLQPDPTAANVYRLAGIPAIVSNQIPEGTAVLLDASTVAVGRDLDASVRLLSERYADHDQLALRVVSRMDIAALNPEGVVRLTPAA